VIVLDTSFLVSFFLSSDVNHEKALNFAKKYKDEEILLTDIILYETLTVLNYKKDIDFCKEIYGELTSNRQIRLFSFSDAEISDILNLFFEQKKLKSKLSIQDISVIYLTNKTKSDLLCFDVGVISAIKSLRTL